MYEAQGNKNRFLSEDTLVQLHKLYHNIKSPGLHFPLVTSQFKIALKYLNNF